MAARKKPKIINIPLLNDFVYSILYNASYQEKRGLPGKYLKAAMTERSARYFCVNSSREEKEFLLSYFGYEFTYILYKKTSSFERIKDLILAKHPTIERISTVIEEGIYLHNDREFQRYLGLASHSLHHPNFKFNNEIVRNHYHIQKWNKSFQNNTDIQDRETGEAKRETAKFVFNSLIVMDNLRNLIGVSATGLKVLLYLYQMRELYITSEKIKDVFAGFLKPNEITGTLRVLSIGNFVSRLITKKQGKVHCTYSITTIGIRTVDNYFNHVYNQNSF